jgi:Icc-related predicted phosphoesterase
MRFIHLSDLHFSLDRFDSFKQFYLDALLKDLIKWNGEKGIDLIFITGDIVDKGGESFSTGENYYKLIEQEILLKIAKTLQIDKSKLIFIPGNHDVKEQSIDEISESGLLHLSSIESINKFVDSNISIYHDGIERIKYYKEFEKEFYTDFENKQLTNFVSCFIHDIEGKKIGIAAFNSAWRFSKELPKDNYFWELHKF